MNASALSHDLDHGLRRGAANARKSGKKIFFSLYAV